MSGSGRSDVKRLKMVGDNMEPCGTLFFRYIVREVLPFSDTWAVLPEMRFASHFYRLGWRFVFRIFLDEYVSGDSVECFVNVDCGEYCLLWGDLI